MISKMNNMLDSKSVILENIDSIFNEYNRINEEKNVELMNIIQECNDLRECNKKLMAEVSEKDKLLIVNEKKMVDYEHMINKIQEDAMKEKTEKERFDMLKKQDKEIYDRDIEINRLQKKLELLEEKLTMFNNNSDVGDIVQEVREEREEKTLVERMKSVKKIQEEEKPTEVVEEEEEEVVVEEEEQEKPTEVVEEEEEQQEKPTEVVEEEVVEEVVEEKPTEVVENPDDKIEGEDSGEETEELSDEEGEEVEIITHYKKEYYIIVNEKPQYIYTIEDGDLGEKVGEVQGKKKVFYNSSKN